MTVLGEHKVGVSAIFDDGIFDYFKVVSKKNLFIHDNSENNIQEKEDLTYEDFIALEIMIAQTINNFLDMKYREKAAIQALEEE